MIDLYGRECDTNGVLRVSLETDLMIVGTGSNLAEFRPFYTERNGPESHSVILPFLDDAGQVMPASLLENAQPTSPYDATAPSRHITATSQHITH